MPVKKRPAAMPLDPVERASSVRRKRVGQQNAFVANGEGNSHGGIAEKHAAAAPSPSEPSAVSERVEKMHQHVPCSPVREIESADAAAAEAAISADSKDFDPAAKEAQVPTARAAAKPAPKKRLLVYVGQGAHAQDPAEPKTPDSEGARTPSLEAETLALGERSPSPSRPNETISVPGPAPVCQNVTESEEAACSAHVGVSAASEVDLHVQEQFAVKGLVLEKEILESMQEEPPPATWKDASIVGPSAEDLTLTPIVQACKKKSDADMLLSQGLEENRVHADVATESKTDQYEESLSHAPALAFDMKEDVEAKHGKEESNTAASQMHLVRSTEDIAEEQISTMTKIMIKAKMPAAPHCWKADVQTETTEPVVFEEQKAQPPSSTKECLNAIAACEAAADGWGSDRVVSICIRHPAFQEFDKSIRSQFCSVDENMWRFGSVAGDPQADFQDFQNYLLAQKKREDQNNVESDDGLSDLSAKVREVDNDMNSLDPESEDSSGEDCCLELCSSQENSFQGSMMRAFLEQAWNTLQTSEKRAIKENLLIRTHGLECGPGLATMCSGSGMAEFAHRCLREALGSEDAFLFSCEKENWKKTFLQEIVHPVLSHDAERGCIFSDMAALKGRVAPCQVHKKKRALPPLVFLLMVGYSCKTLSRLNPNGCQPGALRAGSGSSGETCHALLEFLRLHRPLVCLLENVEEMGRDEDKSDNVAFFMEKLEEHGYVVASHVFDTANFGLPQHRKRAWQIILCAHAFKDPTGAEEAVLAMMSMAKRFSMEEAWCLDRFLLPEDHPAVQAELRRNTSAGTPGHGEDWKKKHREFVKKKGIAWNQLQLRSEIQASPWIDRLTAREKETLAYGLMVAEQKGFPLTKAAVNGQGKFVAAAVDVSQRIDRCRIAVGAVLHTMVPGQKTWIVARDPAGNIVHNRLLLGCEALALQGFPLSARSFSENQQQDLAGNAFSGTIVLSLLLGVYARLPAFAWKDSDLFAEGPNFESVVRQRFHERTEEDEMLENQAITSAEDVVMACFGLDALSETDAIRHMKA